MKKLTSIFGKSIPLAMNDVDTDFIIPAQYLTSVSKQGYGENLFRRAKESNPDFIFNQNKFNDANIIISQHNFGCGSSREHAVWALQEAGIEAIIAISFADIFASNSAKNGLLLIEMHEDIINSLITHSYTGTFLLNIDIIKQQISTSDGDSFVFAIDKFHQYCLINGINDLDYLLIHQEEIAFYRKFHSDFLAINNEEIA